MNDFYILTEESMKTDYPNDLMLIQNDPTGELRELIVFVEIPNTENMWRHFICSESGTCIQKVYVADEKHTRDEVNKILGIK